MLGGKGSSRIGVSADDGLGLIHKSIRQRVAANVTDRECFPFPLQHEINVAAEVTNASGFDGAADAHALAFRGACQGLKFGDGVVVSLALAITQPRQKTQRSHNYTDSQAKFCLFLHSATPTPPSIRQSV